MKARRVQRDGWIRSSGSTDVVPVYEKVKPIELWTVHQTLPNAKLCGVPKPSLSPGTCVFTRKDAL